MKTAWIFILGVLAFVPNISLANIPGGGTGTGAAVTLTDNGTTVTMANGIVSIVITKADASIHQIAYTYNNSGSVVTNQLLNGGNDGGLLYWTGNPASFGNMSFTYSVVANTSSYAEVSLVSTYTTGIMEIHYSMLQGSTGFYCTPILTHRSTDSAVTIVMRPNIYAGSQFNWMSVDAARNKLMEVSGGTSIAAANAPKECTLWTNGIYQGLYEDKYKYSADMGTQRVWGWSSVGSGGTNVGLWNISGSVEYYPGGPMLRSLMEHIGTTILNVFTGGYYGLATDDIIANDEVRTKTYGPYFYYCNNVASSMTNSAQASQALYTDALAQGAAEQSAWPYSWFSNANYTAASGRGTVTGKMVISDSGNPNASAANLWVGVVQQPSTTYDTVYDFQQWARPYQFWVQTDANGNFTIPNVIAGTNYTLYAYGPGANGEFMSQAQTGGNPPVTFNLPATPFVVTVTGGATTSLGNVTWTPTRVAPTVFEIGYPDRTGAKFRHGDDYWVGDIGPSPTSPSPVWTKFLEYPFDFPNGPNYVVGTSQWPTGWNFIQPAVVNSAGVWNNSASTITFYLPSGTSLSGNASLYLGLTSDYYAAIVITVNGHNLSSISGLTATPNASVPSTGYYVGYGSSDTSIREGINGAFSDERLTFPVSTSLLNTGATPNTITIGTRQVGSGYFANHAMYDYVRLELTGYVPPAPASVTAFAGSSKLLLSWPVTPGATSYNILRSTKSGSGYTSLASGVTGPVCGSGPGNATYVDTTAVNGTTYYYVVQSVNPTGTSANSTPSTGVAPSSTAATTAPAAPSTVTATPGNGQVGLSWSTSTGASYYTVQRSTLVANGGGTYVTLSTITLSNAVTGTTYTDATPTNGSIYSYAITATNAVGTSASLTSSNTTPVAPAPTVVPAGVAAAPGALQETVSWSPVAGAIGYVLEQATTSGGPYTLVASATETTYTVGSLLPNTTYYYVVAAVNSGGTGPASAQVSATTAPAAPVNLTALPGNGQVVLNWTASTAATSYSVQRSLVTGGPYTTLNSTVTSPTYTDGNLTNGTTYYYVVAAANTNGTGTVSAQVNATPEVPPSLTWTGATSTAWDTVTSNWLNGSTASVYTDGGFVTFPDGATTSTVVIGAAVNPGSVTFTNATSNYTISGAAISGATSLVINGAGTVTLASANAYTGGTTINAGTMPLTGANGSTAFTAALGTGLVTLAGGELQLAPPGGTAGKTSSTFTNNFVLNGGILYGNDGQEHLTGTISVTAATTLLRQWDNSTADPTKALLLDGVLSGNAPLNVYGTGGATTQGDRTWIDNAANTYSGTITVYASATLTGLSAPAGGNALALGSNTALQDATVDLEGTPPGTDASLLYGLEFGSGVTAPVLGALQGNGKLNLNAFGTGTPAATLTTGGNGATTLFSGIIGGAGGFTKAGTGTMTLSSGANTYTGPTTVTGGVLIILGNFTTSSSISIASGATLSLSGGKLATSGTITNNGTLVLGSGETLSSTGTFTNNGTLDLSNDPSFALPANFVNNGIVLTADTSIATDTPTMPIWALFATACLLCLTAGRNLTRKEKVEG